MDGTYDITIDPVRHLVRTRLTGFFSPAIHRDYLAARAVAFQQLRCGANEHLSLTDIRDMKIQAQDIVAAFEATLADPAYRSKRLGFIVASTLARVQLQRALGDRLGNGVQCFADPPAAERGVLTGPPCGRAA